MNKLNQVNNFMFCARVYKIKFTWMHIQQNFRLFTYIYYYIYIYIYIYIYKIIII